MKLSDHEFSVLAEPGSFKGMMGPAKTETKKKIKPNAICPLCDSGKKYKKCCGKKWIFTYVSSVLCLLWSEALYINWLYIPNRQIFTI